MTTEFKIIGFTDKVNECDCCNRTGLKGTYCISIDGNEYYYGSTCANKKGVNKVELKKELSNYESIVRFVNCFIFKKSLDINKTSEILEWALNNKGKSLNIFLQ
jgi:hypothetical protein